MDGSAASFHFSSRPEVAGGAHTVQAPRERNLCVVLVLVLMQLPHRRNRHHGHRLQHVREGESASLHPTRPFVHPVASGCTAVYNNRSGPGQNPLGGLLTESAWLSFCQ